MADKPKIFIDGEAGTTGLQIRERLAALPAVDVLSIDPALRKDADARRTLMAAAALVVLCLPDDAAIEAVALADSLGAKAPKIIDASTAHRVAAGWTYGFAELDARQAGLIAKARRVTNPGCYPTGAIALLRPLVDAGMIPKDTAISVNAVSGYTGGGNQMIAAYEQTKTAPAFELYGLNLAHKHVPELQANTGLTRRPIFVPSVGNFPQGMLVSVPLHLDTLPGKPTARDLEAVLAKHYADARLVTVIPSATATLKSRIAAETLAGTDKLELAVFAHEREPQAVLVARLDNLGKGAAGAAVQNMKLMLGLDDA
jgi:N-acetyl-gamma-glutamyl-phosphate reductase